MVGAAGAEELDQLLQAFGLRRHFFRGILASSSAADALRCVTWSTCASASCDLGDAGGLLVRRGHDFLTRSAVLRIDGTSSSSSTARAVRDADALREPSADLARRRLAALGELAHLGGDYREPVPCSPARAASMAAFRARRLV